MALGNLLLIMNLTAPAQVTQKPRYTMHATVTHQSHTAVVVATDPRPLMQATEAVAGEYGILIDYEDPPYQSSYDRVDNTDPTWRTAHPGAPGVTRIAGAQFTCAFPEIVDPMNSAQREDALTTILSEYSSSGNPGRFKLATTGTNRLAFIGVGVRDDGGQMMTSAPILDTPVTLVGNEHDLWSALSAVMNQVTQESGSKVVPGDVPVGFLATTSSQLSASGQPARAVILQILNASRRKLIYGLLYDPDVKTYFLNIIPASRIVTGLDGERRYYPLD